jgi:hypothetical protein
MWCSIINYSVLIIWFVLFVFAHDSMNAWNDFMLRRKCEHFRERGSLSNFKGLFKAKSKKAIVGIEYENDGAFNYADGLVTLVQVDSSAQTLLLEIGGKRTNIFRISRFTLFQ